MGNELIEYRVVPVTRYIVTKCRTGAPPEAVSSVGECGEFQNLRNANAIAEALADREPYAKDGSDGVDVRVIPFNQVPGRAMRFKLRLNDRRPAVATRVGEDGKPAGRTITVGEGDRAYTVADPEDAKNFFIDGENLRFGAVAARFDKDGNNACEENRIFGKWSPSVDFAALVRNPAALAGLGPIGSEFYVDLIPAPAS